MILIAVIWVRFVGILNQISILAQADITVTCLPDDEVISFFLLWFPSFQKSLTENREEVSKEVTNPTSLL